MVVKIAHEVYSVTDVVEMLSVSAFDVPPATFVDVSIAADQERVSDVVPRVVVHVQVLDRSHFGGAIVEIETFGQCGVMHE